jgi:VWFA-related protein
MRRLALAFVVASTGVATLAGQQPSSQPQTPTPTLRASVEQVVVDVVVTDANGAVVPGLTAADFEIREDGAPQPIVTFSEVVLPFVRREPGAAAPPPAEVRSNRAMAEGRVYLLLLDDLFVMASRTPAVQKVARDFIDRYVQPGDLVAVTTTGGMAGTSQAFTEDMSLVARAVDRFVGKKVRSAAVDKLEQAYRAREMDPQRTRRAGNANTPFNRDGAVLGVNAIDDDVLDRGRLSLRTVKNAVQSMTSVAGRRKTVVYISEGVDIPLGPGDSTEIAREVHAILGQAARANVAVYALSPRGLHGMGDEMSEIRALPTGQTGPIGANYTLSDIQKEQRIADTMLRTVAEGTGGIAMVDANQLSTALDRIVAESSHYYLLGYTPPNPKRDGRYRAIDIALRKPGLHATARKGYAAPDDREVRPEPLKGLPPELGTLLRQPLPAAGLPLAVSAVAFPAVTDNVSVTVEIGPGALTFMPRGDKRFNALDVAILPVDVAGRTHGLTQAHPQLTLSPELADTVVAKGLRLSHRLTLEPGEYQLRVGVREIDGGATGSVLCDLVVPDPAVPGLAMTSIVASASSAITVPSAYNDPGLLWALGGPPTTARAFDRTDTVSAYVELVDAGATAIRDVDLLTVVRDAHGRDVVRSPQPKANGRVAAGRSFAYAVDLPLKALAPGRYVLRIEARASGLAEPLARELTFDVRNPGL